MGSRYVDHRVMSKRFWSSSKHFVHPAHQLVSSAISPSPSPTHDIHGVDLELLPPAGSKEGKRAAAKKKGDSTTAPYGSKARSDLSGARTGQTSGIWPPLLDPHRVGMIGSSAFFSDIKLLRNRPVAG